LSLRLTLSLLLLVFLVYHFLLHLSHGFGCHAGS